LLDEPAAGLRAAEKQALAKLLRELKGEGMSILVVEHDVDFVMGLADRIVVLDFGKKIAEGLPQEIRVNPLVIAAYVGGVERVRRCSPSIASRCPTARSKPSARSRSRFRPEASSR